MEEGAEISHIPPAPTHAESPPLSASPTKSGALVTTDEPPLTHHNHPKFIVYLSVHSWRCIFYGFGQMYNDVCPYHSIKQSIFTALKILCAPPIYPSLLVSPQPLATSDCRTVSIVLPCPECHIVGIIRYVVFSDWFLLRSNMHLRFIHVFSELGNSFIFSTE